MVDDVASRDVCGIVMPISAIDGLSEIHWKQVFRMLSDAAAEADFVPNLVSHSDDVGVIQKRIVQNLYNNPIVICDISARNANVMFEMGMRLAFDKPTIIVKDDKTPYSFDTSPIEHLTYPRDMRYEDVVEFKKNLSVKLKSTHRRAQADPAYTPFLGHFGGFTVPKTDKDNPSPEYVIRELAEIKSLVQAITEGARNNPHLRPPSLILNYTFDVETPNGETKRLMVYGSARSTVQDILDELYIIMGGAVKEHSYLQAWVLRHQKSKLRLIMREITAAIPAASIFFPSSRWKVEMLKQPYAAEQEGRTRPDNVAQGLKG